MSLHVSMTDFFCGAGGSSTGAIEVPGVTVRCASNHWQLAVDTHSENHPSAEHICADLSQIHPLYFPRTTIGWFSPECTNHSIAKGRKRADAQPDLFGETLPDAAAERSRATMWDVVRFSEHHRYELVFVENVVDVAAWLPFHAWLAAMDSLGYDHRLVMLNSMHAQLAGLGAPQSRDRLYVVFWRRGNRAPDLERVVRPSAVCVNCGPVEAMQVFKRHGNTVGRYRSQYVFRCPNVKCRNRVVEPVVRPAADIIDWSLQGQRIGDRPLKEFFADKAKTRSLGYHRLAPKTLGRIRGGIEEYWAPFIVEHGGNGYDAADPRHPRFGHPDGGYMRAWPASTEPLRTVHTRESKALVVPVEGRDGKTASLASGPMRTCTARNESGLAFMAELRGGSSKHRPVDEPLSTVTASGNHHGLVTAYYGNGSVRPAGDPLPTVTTVERHGLITPSGGTWRDIATSTDQPMPTVTTRETDGLATGMTVDINDVLFRMLEPREYKAAMAFPAGYVMRGNRREQVRMAGNAVTPPSSRDLITVGVESLDA